MIRCTKCNIEKPVSEFNKDSKRKTGYQVHCKKCRKEYRIKNAESISKKQAEHYQKNSTHIKQRVSSWKKENKDIVYENNRRYNERKPHIAKNYRNKNKEKMREYSKKYRNNNKDDLKINKSIYYTDHKKDILEKQRISYIKRKPKIRLWSRNYVKRKRQNDIEFRLKEKLRNRIRHALGKAKKQSSVLTHIGCTISELKIYIESLFYPHPVTKENMSWNNHGLGYGKWQLDHIKELRFFNLQDLNDWKEALHYKNLQPLWYEDHIKKTAANFKKTGNS